MLRLLILPLLLGISCPTFADDHTYTYKGKTYKSGRLDKETLDRIPDYKYGFFYKKKWIEPSRTCEKGTKMRWEESGVFRKKLTEIGCMTDREHEKYWRDYNVQRANRPVIINTPSSNNTTSSGGMIVPMYQKPINCTGVNYGGAGFSASCY